MNNDKIKKRINEVIATNAISVNKNDFLATHTPFKKLYYTTGGIDFDLSKVRAFDEETILDKFIFKQREKHNFIVVQGDNGSGKSHFIRWIKEKYENEVSEDEEEIIFISRGQNTLKGTLEQIINSKAFDEEFREGRLKKLIQAGSKLNDDLEKTRIILEFASVIKNDKELKKTERESIYAYLVDSRVQEELMKENGPIDKFYSKFTNKDKNEKNIADEAKFYPDDFKVDLRTKKEIKKQSRIVSRYVEDLNDLRKGAEKRESLAKELNSRIDFVVQNMLNIRVNDLRDIFEELRIELKNKGKKLTILIEDITSFTGIDKALVEVLVTENTGTEYNEKLCRIFSIIGVTNAYYKDNFPDNLKDRVTGRIIIGKDSFLEKEEELSEMAARYINAINLEAEEIEKWVENGAYTEEMPIANNNMYDWCSYNIADGKRLSIFPFTKLSLYNLYNGLEHKTARGLLNKIISIFLESYYNNPEEFINVIIRDIKEFTELPGWREFSHDSLLRKQIPEDFEKISLIIRIWGNGTIYKTEINNKKYIGGIDEEFFKLFKLPIIEGIKDIHSNTNNTDTNKQNTKKNDKTSDISIDNVVVKNINKIEKIEKQPASLNKISNNIPKMEESKEEENLKEFIKDLDLWLDGRLSFKYIKVKEKLIDFIKEFIDWDKEDISSRLINENLNKRRIAIEGQGTAIIEGSYVLKKNRDFKDALLATKAYLEYKSWNFKNSETHILNLTNYILSIEQDIIEYIKYPKSLKEKEKNFPIDRWMIHLEIYKNIINGNIDIKNMYDSERIYEIIIKELLTDKTDDNGYSLNSYDKDLRVEEIKRLKNDDLMLNNKEHIISKYNCILGEKGNEVRSKGVYFIDAAEILKYIELIIDKELCIDNNDKINLKNEQYENPIFSINKKLIELDDRIDRIVRLNDEKSEAIIKKLEYYLGNEINNSDVTECFNEIVSYLDLLDRSKEPYDSSCFKELMLGKLNIDEFMYIKNQLENILKKENKKLLKIIKSKENYIYKIEPYINLLKKTEDLLDKKIELISDKIKDNSNIEETINMKYEEIKFSLNSIKKQLNSL